MLEVSLVDGWLPVVVVGFAVVALIASLHWRGGLWRRELVITALLAAGVVGVVVLANRALSLLPFSFPPSFYGLAGIVVFAVALVVVGWRDGGRGRRVWSVVSIVASIALLATVVNAHYQYVPEVGNLFGRVARHEVALSELDGLRQQTAASGRLPDHGYTVEVEMPGNASGFHARPAYVWLPPAWFAAEQPTLPVVMMLHGTPGGPSDWLVGGRLASVANAFADAHDGKAPILVMPDATGGDLDDTECTNSPRGNAETYLTVDVPRYVDQTFAPKTGPGSWGIAGLSMGGFCALTLSLRHPQQFAVFGDYSGLDHPALDPPDSALRDLFGGDRAALDSFDPTTLLRRDRFTGLAGWFEVGEDDEQPLRDTREVAPLATAAGIETCVLVRPGGHDFDFWHGAFEHSLPFMALHLGLVPAPVDTFGATCTGG